MSYPSTRWHPHHEAILDLGEIKLGGIICPGHVSAIIGTRPYEFIARDYHIACAVAGFEPVDMLLAIERMVEQIENDEPKVENTYSRGVKTDGNCPPCGRWRKSLNPVTPLGCIAPFRRAELTCVIYTGF